jgi:hypothetical protein
MHDAFEGFGERSERETGDATQFEHCTSPTMVRCLRILLLLKDVSSDSFAAYHTLLLCSEQGGYSPRASCDLLC